MIDQSVRKLRAVCREFGNELEYILVSSAKSLIFAELGSMSGMSFV